MSTYFEPGRGWKYDFQFQKRRHQSNYYKTKTEAREAEAEKRKEIRYLRAMFNFGVKKRYIQGNPTSGVEFLPVEKMVKYIPSQKDIDRVIAEATPDVQDYLWTIRDTLGRMSEINRLTWGDVDFKQLTVTLYTRKKRGGHLTPRKIPMTLRLHNILKRRHADRKNDIPWVFWHEFTSSKTGEKRIGPFAERKKIMSTLCKNAGVRYFRFHALRHASASVMDSKNVPIGAIQRILGHENRTTIESPSQSPSQTKKRG